MYTRRLDQRTEKVYDQLKINSQRQVTGPVFYFKIMNGQIDPPKILEQFAFICNKPNVILMRLLDTVKSTQNYVCYGPRNGIESLVNDGCTKVNFFCSIVVFFLSKIKTFK